MIFSVSPAFAAKVSDKDWCELMQQINKNYHFISKNADVLKIIKAKKESEGGESFRDSFQSFVGRGGFRPSREFQRFLTTIEITDGFDLDSFKALVTYPGFLISENCNYEYKVYQHFCSLYTKSSNLDGSPNRLKNIFLALETAMKSNRLFATNNGGDGQLIPTYEYLQETIWKGKTHLKKKCCFLFDRDTDDNQSLSPNHKKLFKFLNSGKDHNNTTMEDIYSLYQPDFIWHMWYKTAIENYISDRCYIDGNVDITQLQQARDRDYYKIDSSSCKHYDKKNLGSIAQKMDRKWLEENTKRFPFDGSYLSEIQLFLLKLVKII